MGVIDRDYARAPRDDRPIRRGRGVMWSFNTWLIVLNVVVFVVNNVFLATPQALRQFDYGTAWGENVSREEMRRAVPMRPEFVVDQQNPGIFLRPLVDPTTRRTVGVERRVFMPALMGVGHFSTTHVIYGLEVWRFVTFQFLHQGITHLVLNLLGLFFVGPIVEEYLGPKRYAAFYLACGIFGALAYLLLNLLGYAFNVRLPFVLFLDPSTPLVGASAGIFGVLLAAAYISPGETVYVAGVLPVPLRVAVYLFATIALVNLFMGTRNAGGEAAHVGGAIAGFYLIRRTHLLRDFFDVFGDSRKGPARQATPRPASAKSAVTGPPAAEVDRILAKIGASGLESLTSAERETLRADTDAKRRQGGS